MSRLRPLFGVNGNAYRDAPVVTPEGMAMLRGNCWPKLSAEDDPNRTEYVNAKWEELKKRSRRNDD